MKSGGSTWGPAYILPLPPHRNATTADYWRQSADAMQAAGHP